MATFEKVVVTPAVCPRLFEFLTTLTFGAQRRNHIASTPSVAIAKKQKKSHCVHSICDHRREKKNRDGEGSFSTCDQQFIMNCQEHNRSRTGNASVLSSMISLLCGEKRNLQKKKSSRIFRFEKIRNTSHL